MEKEKKYILIVDIRDNIYYAYYLIGDWETIKTSYDNLKNDISQRQCEIQEIEDGFVTTDYNYSVVIKEWEGDLSGVITELLDYCCF